jgi:endogenous inhibitor of DNA gyrase (YacG/DUF329 family)
MNDPIKCPHCKKIFFCLENDICPFCSKNIKDIDYFNQFKDIPFKDIFNIFNQGE